MPLFANYMLSCCIRHLLRFGGQSEPCDGLNPFRVNAEGTLPSILKQSMGNDTELARHFLRGSFLPCVILSRSK